MNSNERRALLKKLEAVKDTDDQLRKLNQVRRAVNIVSTAAERLSGLQSLLSGAVCWSIIGATDREELRSEVGRLNREWLSVGDDEQWWLRVSESSLSTDRAEKVITDGMVEVLKAILNKAHTMARLLELTEDRSDLRNEFRRLDNEAVSLLKAETFSARELERVAQLNSRAKELSEKAAARGMNPEFLQFIDQASRAEGASLKTLSEELLVRIDQLGLRPYLSVKFADSGKR